MDRTLARINAIGTVAIAVLTLAFVFALVLVGVQSHDNGTFTAIIALVGPVLGAVTGHYFSMRAMAQGANMQANSAPGTTFS